MNFLVFNSFSVLKEIQFLRLLKIESGNDHYVDPTGMIHLGQQR